MANSAVEYNTSRRWHVVIRVLFHVCTCTRATDVPLGFSLCLTEYLAAALRLCCGVCTPMAKIKVKDVSYRLVRLWGNPRAGGS
jgi:hypothetical protein